MADERDIKHFNKMANESKQRAANYMSLKGALEPKQETIEEVTKQIQNDCHTFTKLVVPNVSYQDATNTFLFMKLAELTLKIQNYEK
jgi:hypothetical protein